MKRSAVALILALAVSVPGVSRAAVVINAVETGGDVVFSYSGSIDVSSLNFLGGFSTIGTASIAPTTGMMIFGSSGAELDVYNNVVDFPSFGSGLGQLADSATGDGFAVTPLTLFVPFQYSSGDPISGTVTFDNETFASLGLTAGIYMANVMTDLQDLSSVVDTITLNIGTTQVPDPTPGVPEPATLALLGIGLAGLGFSRRKLAVS